MDKALVKSSGIFYLKSKFFIIRALSYFSFLLIPILSQKSGGLPFVYSALAGVFYTFFMMSQWFFLGKEIDHRLKIYFRVNSSMDRVIYRLFLGMFFFIIYFNVLYLFPGKWINNLFWATWVMLGIFYSWPTRGKIIRESVTTNFTEFKYLDAFEKTLVFLTIIMFFISIPELPKVIDYEAMKLYFLPGDTVSSIYWNFLTVSYYPFFKYKELFALGWALYFYFVNLSLFLICFYALLRFFLCRRLSILGIFAVVSSWSWSKVLVANYGDTLLCTYSLIWVWTILWVIKSETYRTGLFLGLVGFFGVLIKKEWFILWPLLMFYTFYFMKEKSSWYRRQVARYSSLGFVLTLILLFVNLDNLQLSLDISSGVLSTLERFFSRKAIFTLSPIGLGLVALIFLDKKSYWDKWIKVDLRYLQILASLIATIIIVEMLFPTGLFSSYAVMWTLCIFALIPLELIFQTMSRLRSSRNMIYLVYILICLLDSHFEGRVKIFLRLLDSLS